MINLINKLLFLLHLPLITYNSPYTKEERNKIYKEALELFKKKEPNGLCSVLWAYIEELPELYIYNSILSDLTEGKRVYYYWRKGKKEPRIKALERAIKLTE